MVSKQQKLARKRFKEANPHLFPSPPQPSGSESSISKKKEKKEKWKLKAKARALKVKAKLAKEEGKGGGRSSSSTGRKHPLRVPGMRPGERCFICKSSDHVAKLCPEKAKWDNNKTCLFCRQRGHSLKNCPEKDDGSKFCYNCGEHGHALSKCPKPLQDGGTKFADCFICKEQGHLSKNCPKNKNGVYPKGGSCKVCGEVTHLAKHCPNKGNRSFASSTAQQNTLVGTEQSHQGLLPNTLRSGDDLDDDFGGDEDVITHKADTIGKVEKSSVRKKVEKTSHGKPKTKQGPKVVNFVG